MINIAIVGYGYWGPKLFRAFNEDISCHVKYVCDKEKINLVKSYIKYDDAKSVSKLDILLNDKDLNAVVIATPISTHYELAKKFLKAGKHVLVEKPLATKVQHAQELIDLATKKNRILMVDHTFLYHSAVKEIKKLIISKKLGEIYFIDSSRVNLGLHHADASVIWDLMPHELSILLYWLDEFPVSVATFARGCINAKRPDTAFVNFTFASGTIANTHVSWLAPAKLRKTVIVGSKKMVLFDDTESIEKVKIFTKGAKANKSLAFKDPKVDYFYGNIVSPLLKHYEPLAVVANHFISCIATGSTPLTDGINGLRVVKILEAIQKSLDRESRVVRVKL